MRTLYAAFDRFPTRKGASTHIARFAPALFGEGESGLLFVLGDDDLPRQQFEGTVEILRHHQPEVNFLERALGYAAHLSALLDERADEFSLCQFRDPWSGMPLLARRRRYATVFEVNALPSIELGCRYPALSPRTREKIHARERWCLDACDHVITPSATTRRMLMELGVQGGKISVVPNGADLHERPARPAAAPDDYLIYFGALQPWQGVDTLLRAFARLADIDTLQLVICASAENRDARRLQRLAERLGVGERLLWRYALESGELAAWLGHARASIAPLSDCARNVVQGCAPLKILEAMAAGVPTIASDLPPVREILRDGVEGRLVAPDRPAELARAIRILLAYPQQAAALGAAARQRIAAGLTWDHSLAALRGVYAGLRQRPVAAVPEAALDTE